ncbi:MAG: CBS domain-containing protein [Candidatus Omnitrophota bacterium]|nr:CBS domain-containing protein [Candidatus Omnitrophota bacterium]
MKVKDIMTKEVITVKPSMDLHKLAKLLIKKNISGAPVVDADGKFLGVVLEEGLIFQDKKVQIPAFITLSMGFFTLGMPKFKEEMRKIAATTVKDIMEKDVVKVSSQATVEDVATIMVDKKSYYCPVVEGGSVVGIITKKDIVRAIVNGDIW